MATSEIDLLRRELSRQKAARKEAERLLEEKNLELFNRINELEMELAERRRAEVLHREQAALLKESNSELEQFAYVASHDLKAPLRSVAVFAQLLMKQYAELIDEDGREYLSFIDNGVRQMHMLIDDLLEFSRVGRDPMNKAWVSSERLVNEVWERLKGRVETTGAELATHGLSEIWCDRGQLGRVIQNLLDNSMKFQPKGQKPVVRVSCEASDDGWTLFVQDNGIGISPEYQERIFKLFQRLNLAEDYSGTGLGLSICRKIIERHGGTIALDEKPVEGGTCFRFSLCRPAPSDHGN